MASHENAVHSRLGMLQEDFVQTVIHDTAMKRFREHIADLKLIIDTTISNLNKKRCLEHQS